LGLLTLLGRLLLLAADGDLDAAPEQGVHLLLDLCAVTLGGALLPSLSVVLLLGDVDELAAPAQVIRDHLELSHLADGLAARGDRDVLVGGGRGGHAPEGNRRAADDHRLGGGGPHRTRVSRRSRGLRAGAGTAGSRARAAPWTGRYRSPPGVHAGSGRSRTAASRVSTRRRARPRGGTGPGGRGNGAGAHALGRRLGDDLRRAEPRAGRTKRGPGGCGGLGRRLRLGRGRRLGS